jgi:Skp family chaperone for outer membrane proteins
VQTWSKIVLGIALALGASVATPSLDVAGAAADPRPQVADRGQAREAARQKIRALRAAILVEELQLDEATAGKLAPILARHDDELARLQAERRALRKAMRDAQRGTDDRKLDALIDQLAANQRARWDREEARFAEVRRLLTPRQAARLLDVLPQIDRRILQGLRRAVTAPDGAADTLDDDGDAPPRPRPRRLRRGH